MKVEFKSSFAKDLRKIKERRLKQQILEVIEQIEKAGEIAEISDVKKLQGTDNYLRLKLGDYRLGFVIEKDTIFFVRFLHRKDIYRYFP